MISKKLVLILSLCVAGSLVSLQAAPCGNNVTFDTVDTTTCDIGAYTFHFVSFNVTQAGSSDPAGGLTASQVQFFTLTNANGTGFLLRPNVPFDANGGGNIDSELKYYVTGANITSNYLEVDGGNATPDAFAHVQDLFCLGGGLANIDNPPCNGNTGNTNLLSEIDATIVGVGATTAGHADGATADGCSNGSVKVSPTSPAIGPQACGVTLAFDPQTSIAVQKDINISGLLGGTGATASIDGVINQFGPAVVPEPGTYVLSFIGLGLLFLGNRKYSRS